MAHLLAAEQAGQGRSGGLFSTTIRDLQPARAIRRSSTVTLSIEHRLDLTSLLLYSHVPAQAAPLLPACHLATPQAATTSANRKRDAPSPKPSIWSCRALLRRPPASTGLELNRNPDCCSSQTSPLSTSIRKFVLLSQRLSAATKRQRHSSLRPQLY
jgi:hypothetical protein